MTKDEREMVVRSIQRASTALLEDDRERAAEEVEQAMLYLRAALDSMRGPDVKRKSPFTADDKA